MNYYEHHIGDYAEATAHLSFVEDAAYSRMLRKYYAIEGPLPAEIRAAQRLVVARTDDEREAVVTVLNEFFFLLDDGWHNARCDEEIARFNEKRSKARNSASMRWHNNNENSSNANAIRTHGNDMRTHTNDDANAMRTQCERNALQSPVTSHQEETLGVPSVARAKFDISDCPANINREAWADWVSNRRKRKKPISERAAHEQWRTLSGLSPPQQAECIAASIRNDWQGLFPEKFGGLNGPRKQPNREGSIERAIRDAEEHAASLDAGNGTAGERFVGTLQAVVSG